MKIIIVGLGVQGKKRFHVGGNDVFATVDPYNSKSNFKYIQDVPLKKYDAVICSVPDNSKYEIIKYSLENYKHILIEKPLFLNQKKINYLQNLANKHNLFCYTAYNHRFEPHFVRMKKLLMSEDLGKIYSCRLFYGNGTAKLVRESKWRDKGLGVLPDLGSHLLDTCNFWFNDFRTDYKLLSINRFENKSPDHVILSSEKTKPRIEMEMTLCMWKNYFTCDIIAELGSAHITSLCKWGPSTFIKRKRIFPSGKPKEYKTIIISHDLTWKKEYLYFKKNIKLGTATDLINDVYVYNQLNNIQMQKLK